ncbi:probable cysteine--tRNA ligase, mitochondrial [Euwallacea fornicatus]|uniref:probable cysteine--tRNA ligase, mitochondrial n=1 Tax=Euwallacea fornicatus TaxID=995702 RepID=UPI00338DE27B
MLLSKSNLFCQKITLLPKNKHSWTLPIGHNTSINIFNCVTKKNEPLIVKNKQAVTWYTCGPTVYDSAHVGHASCYVKLDIIQRILRQHFGLNLVTCMNVTDIDDKIIKKAAELKVDYKELSKKYEKEFWNDLKSLSILEPNIIVRVTDNIPLIISFIEQLIQHGAAYKALDNSVYFDVSKSPYPQGKLQNISEDYPDSSNQYKKSPADFALWKNTKYEGEPHFISPWGKGRPGWHIECSALASHIFGSEIDIHAGGLDLRFPHHENEEIQSCVFHGKCQWVNYWLHIGHLHSKDSVKMSKSLKNTLSIQDMLKSTKPEVFRMACVKGRYTTSMEFNSDLLKTAANSLSVFKNFVVTITEVKRGIIKPCLNNVVLAELLATSVRDIHTAFCDDFNTPHVMQVLNNIVSKINSMLHSSTNSAESFCEMHYLLGLTNVVINTLDMFGIDLSGSKDIMQSDSESELIELLVSFRHDIRNLGLSEKNVDILTLCDGLRDKLKFHGLTVKDHGKVSSWSR